MPDLIVRYKIQIQSTLQTLDPLLLWGIAGGVALGVLVLVLRALFFGKRGASQRAALAEARKAARRGDFEAAGEILLDVGRTREAAEAFEHAQSWGRAAEARRILGDFAKAAEHFERSGEAAQASQMWARKGDHARAALVLDRAGKSSLAADHFARAGDHVRAAKAHEEMGALVEAAEEYLKGKQELEAARCLEQAAVEARTQRLEGETHGKGAVPLARRAGDLYLAHGRGGEAVRVFLAAGLHDRAGEAYFKLGRFEEAARAFERAGRADRAAESFRKIDRPKDAARVLGEAFRNQGQTLEAARCMAEAEDWAQAGELYRQAGDPLRAAEMYLRGGDPSTAGDLFLQAGDKRQAARSFESARRLDEAVRIYQEIGERDRIPEILERNGDFLGAGRSYVAAGLADAAIRALQRIEVRNPRYQEAQALLGQAFQAKGLWNLALTAYQAALADRPLSPETVELYYDLALAREKMGDLSGARAGFERVAALDFHFRDTAARLAALGRVPSPGAATPPPPAPGGAPIDPTVRGAPPPERYRLVEEVGRGGMGIVYRATDSLLGRTVALKILPAHLKEDPAALQVFRREAATLAKLLHPNIVAVFDAGERPEGPFLVMEYVEGKTLREVLARRGRLSLAEALAALREMARALEFAHARGIIHRDVKPSNVMVAGSAQGEALRSPPTAGWRVKLMDFGLARLFREAGDQATRMAGTPRYMAPEQIQGGPVDGRTDLYALGVTVFEMLAGRPPFVEGDVSYHHVHTPPPDLNALVPGLPPGIVEAVGRCLVKDREGRMPSAQALLEAVDREP